MNDPRDGVMGHEDNLTESSSDELADLQKEYELKVQKLMEKKKEKQELKKIEQKIEEPQVQRSPVKKSKRIIVGEETSNEGERTARRVGQEKQKENKILENIRNRQEPAKSSFIEKLYEANSVKTDKIDFSNRRFEFEKLPKRVAKDVDEVDELSHEHLRKRYAEGEEVKALLKDVKVFRIEKLLAKVAPPDYGEPNYENWAFTGIITRKSEPKTTKEKKKFMKLSVGGYEHTVDLMLFGSAFQKYWKLKVGDLIVILNPQINKFSPPFKGFNLKLDDSLDCLIEMGSVKNFGHCSAMRKDNTPCTTVVNTSRASLCAYHLDAKFKKTSNKRMELNGSVQLKSPTKKGVKQSVYMDPSGLGGHFSYESINQETKVYGYAGNRDPSLYQNPKILENLKGKRTKMMNERVNMILERKLMNLSQNSSLRKLGLIKKDHTAKTTHSKQSTAMSLQEKKDNLKSDSTAGTVSGSGSVDKDVEGAETAPHIANPSARVFDSKTLGKIGFNPIPSAPTRLTVKERGNLPKPLKELYDISSTMKRTLASSKEDRDAKRKRVRKCMDELKSYEQKTTLASNGKSGNRGATTAPREQPAASGSGRGGQRIDLGSDSDSDLDIRFDDSSMRKRYSAIVGANTE